MTPMIKNFLVRFSLCSFAFRNHTGLHNQRGTHRQLNCQKGVCVSVADPITASIECSNVVIMCRGCSLEFSIRRGPSRHLFHSTSYRRRMRKRSANSRILLISSVVLLVRGRFFLEVPRWSWTRCRRADRGRRSWILVWRRGIAKVWWGCLWWRRECYAQMSEW